MNRFLPAVAALAMMVIFAAPPPAMGEMSSNYAVVKAGAYFPGSDDLGGASGVTGADTGPNVEGAFGHYFSRQFALEAGVGIFATEGTFQGSDETFVAVPVTLSAKMFFPMENVEPYVMAGLGVYFVDDEIDTQAGDLSDDDTSVGVHVGAGVNVNISPLLFIGAEVRYLWVEVTTFGADTELNGLTATANVGFRF